MHRRHVLKAAGATSMLPFVSGVATAGDSDQGGNGNGQSQRECPRPNCIHPTLGYAGLDPDEDLPSPLQPDHEVELETRMPAEDGDRELPEFVFEPTGLSVEEGDVVRFNLADPDHTVTAYHPDFGRQRRVPAEVPPFSSPVLAEGAFWLYRFDQSGVYDVLCAPHEIFGMVGRIVVGDPSSDWMADEGEGEGESGDGNGEEGPQLRPPELTAALVFADPALEPGNIVEQGEVSWDDLADESKRVLVEFPEEGEA